MGIWNKFFSRKEETPVEQKETTKYVHDSIESILLVLENLSLMNKEEIRQRIMEKEYYNEVILDSLEINPPSGIEILEKYYGKTKFGYGQVKIHQFRDKLKAIASDKYISGVPEERIVEGLIMIIEPEIMAYQGILIRFNESLKQVEETASDYTEMTTMIDYWKNYYKEQEFGYPVPLEKKIEELAKELKNLPYGGYGEVEINQFIEAATKMKEEATLNNEESAHTLSRITTDLFTPKKNRYLADVENLKRKIEMIETSPYLSEFEKDQNKQKLIKEFNLMNGHKQDMTGFVEQLQQNLTRLEFGGYGEEVLNQFMRRAETMISDGKRIMKPEAEVKREIQSDYQRLVDAYQARLQKLKEQINAVDQWSLAPQQKDQKKSLLLEDFHDEMGLPIDFKERLNAMILELKGLDRGGYGELRIEEFKTKSLERLEAANNRLEVRDALREVREIEERLITEYQDELRKLYDASERISHDRHLTSDEKQRAIEEFDREFKFKMGYRMNFDKYIENRAEELATLPGGGYGKEAVDEFREQAQAIAQSIEEEKEKYDKIRQKFTAYKKQYSTNLKTFKEWKKLQLKHVPAKDRDTFEKDLNIKIAYMLSLSPTALQDYYLEDDRKKKEMADKHNYIAAFKFLAKQEAKHTKNEDIYVQRLRELELGKDPYTKDEIEEAISELKLISISGEEQQEDEKIISLVEYIDSTLLRQMMYVEASLNETN